MAYSKEEREKIIQYHLASGGNQLTERGLKKGKGVPKYNKSLA